MGSRLIRFDLDDLDAYRRVQREPARRGPLAEAFEVPSGRTRKVVG